MNFRIVADIDAFESASFTYLAGDFSLVSDLDHSAACGGFLVNDIAIEIDATGTPLAVGGYCPSFDWVRGSLEIPRMQRKKIRMLPDDNILPEPGAYRSLNGDTPWPVHMDFFAKALGIRRQTRRRPNFYLVRPSLWIAVRWLPFGYWTSRDWPTRSRMNSRSESPMI